MPETLYSYLVYKYGAKNHTFQICSHHLFASWASLFFFRHQVLVEAMISSIGLSANSLHSLLFLKTFTISYWVGFLPFWNYIYNTFLIPLKKNTCTQRVCLCLTPSALLPAVSLALRGALKYKTFQLCATDRDDGITRTKALRGQQPPQS